MTASAIKKGDTVLVIDPEHTGTQVMKGEVYDLPDNRHALVLPVGHQEPRLFLTENVFEYCDDWRLVQYRAASKVLELIKFHSDQVHQLEQRIKQHRADRNKLICKI